MRIKDLIFYSLNIGWVNFCRNLFCNLWSSTKDFSPFSEIFRLYNTAEAAKRTSNSTIAIADFLSVKVIVQLEK